MKSDDDLFVFRRFESTNAGVILWIQDRIVKLKSDFKKMHQKTEDSADPNRMNGSFRMDE